MWDLWWTKYLVREVSIIRVSINDYCNTAENIIINVHLLERGKILFLVWWKYGFLINGQ
jgi:hypothetical protein